MARWLVLFLIATNCVFAQGNRPYWYRDEKKVFLDENHKNKFVLARNVGDEEEFRALVNLPNLKIRRFGTTAITRTVTPYGTASDAEQKWAIIEDVPQTHSLTSKATVEYEASFFYTADRDEVGISHLFYVKLRNDADFEKLVELAAAQRVTIVGRNKFMPLWVTLACSKWSAGNSLQMANLFYESGAFAASEPNFMVNNLVGCVNDTHFGNQWGLNNTGQNGGFAGADINACDGWSLTQGDADIIVAVLDQGVQLDHPDLPMYPQSYNTETGTSPSQVLGNRTFGLSDFPSSVFGLRTP